MNKNELKNWHFKCLCLLEDIVHEAYYDVYVQTHGCEESYFDIHRGANPVLKIFEDSLKKFYVGKECYTFYYTNLGTEKVYHPLVSYITDFVFDTDSTHFCIGTNKYHMYNIDIEKENV